MIWVYGYIIGALVVWVVGSRAIFNYLVAEYGYYADAEGRGFALFLGLVAGVLWPLAIIAGAVYCLAFGYPQKTKDDEEGHR